MIAYGSIISWTRAKLSTTKLQLNRLQRICIALSEAMRLTPTAELIPLSIFITKETMAWQPRIILNLYISIENRLETCNLEVYDKFFVVIL